MITDKEIYELAQICQKKYILQKEDLSSEFKSDNLQELLKKYNDLKCTALLSNDDLILESIAEAQSEINKLWISFRSDMSKYRDTIANIKNKPADEDYSVSDFFPSILKENKESMRKVLKVFNEQEKSTELDLKKCILAYEIWCELYDIGLTTSFDQPSTVKWGILAESFPIKLKLWKHPQNIDPVKLVKGFNLLEKMKQIYAKVDEKYTKLKDKQKDILSKINRLTGQLGTAKVDDIDKISKVLAKEILKYANSRKEEKLSIISKLLRRKVNNSNQKYGSGLALLLFGSEEKIDKDNIISLLVKLTKLGLVNSYKWGTNLPGKNLKTNSVKAYEKIISTIRYNYLPTASSMIKGAKKCKTSEKIELWVKNALLASRIPRNNK